MGKDRGSSDMDFGIRVGAVIVRDRAFLLARHRKPGLEPYWVLPGGRLEPGETIPECAEREVAEETGLSGIFAGILYVSEFLRDGRHTVDVTARVDVDPEAEAILGSDPEAAPGSEPTLSELRWVSVDELREIELLPAGIKSRLLTDAASGSSGSGIYLGAARDG
ncbi:MAG: NUDIX domain-containing protein [Rubrobacteraceae bacterium]